MHMFMFILLCYLHCSWFVDFPLVWCVILFEVFLFLFEHKHPVWRSAIMVIGDTGLHEIVYVDT
jgi:hypothetical protein